MWLFAFLVSMLVAQAFVAGPALGQARGRVFSGSSSPRMPGPGVGGPMTGGTGDTLGATPNTGSSMSGGIPGTFDATPFNSGSSTTGAIPGTLGGAPFNSGGSTTGAIGGPSTQGTSTTGSTDLLGNSVLGGSSGTGR
jgi:hypothetical protein